MTMHIKSAAIVALSAALLAAPAAAQPKAAEPQSSNMGPASGNRDGANNGVGTAGSLTHDAGTASSKVTGANANLGSPASKGADKPMEGDPAQGGGTKQ